MSTSKAWSLDKTSLREALRRFDASHPGPDTRRRVNEWLMDLVQDPLHRGREDPDQPGAFFGRVAGTDVGVVFVIDVDGRKVYVTDIARG